jgi:hypothetical protein
MESGVVTVKSQLCFKVPDDKSREKILRKIDTKTFRGAYGSKSCRCQCSCNDGY